MTPVKALAEALHSVKPRIYEAQQGGYWLHGQDIEGASQEQWVPLAAVILANLQGAVLVSEEGLAAALAGGKDLDEDTEWWASPRELARHVFAALHPSSDGGQP